MNALNTISKITYNIEIDYSDCARTVAHKDRSAAENILGQCKDYIYNALNANADAVFAKCQNSKKSADWLEVDDETGNVTYNFSCIKDYISDLISDFCNQSDFLKNDLEESDSTLSCFDLFLDYYVGDSGGFYGTVTKINNGQF
jgi:hypothetical protein